MANPKWEGKAIAIAQADMNAIVDTTGTDATVFTIRLYPEDGTTNTANFSYTASDGTATSTLVADITSSWNADGNPLIATVTGATTGSWMELTADTAGKPFTTSFNTSTNGSSTAAYAWSTTATAATATSVSNSGPNVYSLADNWEAGAIPGAGDNVRIPAGSASILYGLDQDGVTINSFRVEAGYTGTIGGTDGGYLRITMGTGDRFEFAGEGTAWVDLGTANVVPIITNTASAATGKHGLYLKGQPTNVYIYRGNVGYGVEVDDGTTRCDTFHVSFVNNVAGDVALTIGDGVFDVAGTSNPDVNQTGGTVVARDDVHLLTMTAGEFALNDPTALTNAARLTSAGTISGPGVFRHDSTGTVTGLTLSNGAQYRNERDVQAKTVSAITVKSNDVTVIDKFGKVTWSAGVDFDNTQHDRCVLDFGPNKILTPSAS